MVMIRISWLSFLLIVTSTCVFAAENITAQDSLATVVNRLHNSIEHDNLSSRSARRAFAKIKEKFAEMRLNHQQLPSIHQLLSDKSLVSSVRNESLLARLNPNPSLANATAISLATGSSKAFSLFPLLSSQQNVGNIQNVNISSAKLSGDTANDSMCNKTAQTDSIINDNYTILPTTSTHSVAKEEINSAIARNADNIDDSQLVVIVQPDSLINDKIPILPASHKETVTKEQSNEGAEIKADDIADDSVSKTKKSKIIIVQPESLMDDFVPPKMKLPTSHAPTKQQLAETAKIRDEINFAVEHDTYAYTSSDNQAKKGRPSNMFDVWKSFVASNQNITATNETVDKIIGLERSDFSFVPQNGNDDMPSDIPIPHTFSHINLTLTDADKVNDEKVKELISKQSKYELSKEKIIANLVESYAYGGVDNLQPIETSDVREVLQITSVIEDTSFKIGHKTFAWKTLQRNSRDKHALVGLTATGIILVFEQNGVYELKKELVLLSAPTCFTTFTHWNPITKSIEGIVVVGIQNDLVFIRVNEAMNDMDMFWMWPTNKHLSTIEYFNIENVYLILVVSADSKRPSADLYRFDLQRKEFWLRQGLSLAVNAKTVAYLQNGFEHFLCFPQKKSALVYKYINDHFKYYIEIPAENIETIAAFEMGGHTYLALGGAKPKILRYHRGAFQDQTILAPSWGIVEYFFPIPARTYRDDLIVLIQHRIEFESHNISVVEALIWDGEAFDPALSVPCFINNRKSELGLGCILDDDRIDGIQGATVIQRNRYITLLTPRYQAPSGLFDLEIQLQSAIYSYDDELLDLFSETLVMLDAYDEGVMNSRKIYLEYKATQNEDVLVTNQQIDSIATHQIEIDDEVAPTVGVFLGGEQLKSQIVSEFFQILTETQTNLAFLENKIRKKREWEQQAHTHMKSMNVTNLNADFINGIPVSEFIFVTKDSLHLDGTLILQQPLDVDEVIVNSVNDAIVSESMVNESLPHHSAFRNEDNVIDLLEIPGDFNFEEINGNNWKNFAAEIVMKNLPNRLSNIAISGELIVDDSITVEYLNDLPFPDSFVWNDGSQENIITGTKKFTNILVTNAIDCTGTINGVDPSNIITLTGSQFITGTTTFKQLEVTESLEVSPTGKIAGRHLNDFLANPTLLQTSVVTSSCLINSMEVDGSIFIQNTLNNLMLDDILSDVIYKHEPAPKCNSFKIFRSLIAPNIKLTSNRVNGIRFDDFVTNDTDQTFNVNKIHGDVFFNQLKLDGLFNFINITELDENSIKLSGEQYTEAELIFKKGNALDIDVNQLEIIETINNMNVTDFIGIDENFELAEDVILNTITTNECIIGGEINSNIGGGSLNGWRLKELENSYLSKSKEQQINVPFYVHTAVVRGPFIANEINGYNFTEALVILKNLKTNEQLLKEPIVNVNRMHINGKLTVMKINDYELETIKANAIRLDTTNDLKMSIKFLDPIVINGNLAVNLLNDIDFNTFVDDLVLKSDSKPSISVTTVFRENVVIFNDITTKQLNGYPVESILTKNYLHPILNPINVYGDVTVSHLNADVDGTLNGVSGNKINYSYQFDEKLQSHVLTQNVFSNESFYVNYLQLNGGFNNVDNVKYFLETAVKKNQPNVITGTKTFLDQIHFDSNLQISDYNGIDVKNFLSNVILIDQIEPVNIYSHVIFENQVTFTQLNINGDLKATQISSCFVNDWFENAIRTDLPFSFSGTITFGDGSLDAREMNVTYLNDKRVDNILTLETAQYFAEHVSLGEVVLNLPINVKGNINGVNLTAERDNTLMVNGDQYVITPLIFHTVRVLKNLYTVDTVNSKDIKSAVSLLNDIYLESPLSFTSIAANNLYTMDQISGIDLNEWTRNSFRRWSSTPQVVTGHWNIENAYIDDMTTQFGINNVDVNGFAQKIDSANKNVYQHYKQTCDRVQDFIDDSHDNVLFLSHFEDAFKVMNAARINSFYLFKIGDQNYLLVNGGCITDFYYWHSTKNQFEKLCDVHTGAVDAWIHVMDSQNVLYFVSNEKDTASVCIVSGANIWQYNPNAQTISPIIKFGNSTDFKSLQIKPQNREYFYALRKSDNRVIEYNLHGTPISEWIIDPIGSESSLRFVPLEANLGLAIFNDKTLSLLTAPDQGLRRRRDVVRFDKINQIPDWNGDEELKRQLTHQTITRLRKAYEEYLIATNETLVNVSCDNCFGRRLLTTNEDVEKVDKIRKLVSETDMTIVPYANELIATLQNEYNASSNNEFNRENDTKPLEDIVGIAEERSLVNLMDLLKKMIQENRLKNEENNNNYSPSDYENSDYEALAAALLQHFNVTNAQNDTKSAEDIVGNAEERSVADLVELLEKAIRESRLSEQQNDSLSERQPLNVNESDPKVGSIISDMRHLLVHGLHAVKDLMSGDLTNDDKKRGFGILGSEKNFTQQSINAKNNKSLVENKIVGDIFGNVQGKVMFDLAKAKLLKEKHSNDEIVGDKFGELLDKLTPTADNIFDKIVDEYKERRQQEEYYRYGNYLGVTHNAWISVNGTNPLKLNLTMHDIVKKLADSLQTYNDPLVELESNQKIIDLEPKEDDDSFLVGGVFSEMKDAAVTVYKFGKHLYEDVTFIHNRMHEDNNNDNKSYGAPEHINHVNRKESKPVQVYEHEYEYGKDVYEYEQKHRPISNKEFANQYEEHSDFDTSGYDSPPNIDVRRIKLPTLPAHAKSISKSKSKPTIDVEDYADGDVLSLAPMIRSSIETTVIAIPNHFLPSHTNGEIVAVKVGPNRKTLFIVSSLQENVIKGDHDSIQIFEDVIESKLFQTIPCYKPRSLTTFQSGAETVLAFLTGDSEVMTFIYRGVQGFIEFTSFDLPAFVTSMKHIQIASSSALFACPNNYLVLSIGNELWFLKAVTIGNCKVTDRLKC